jgi:protein TonB
MGRATALAVLLVAVVSALCLFFLTILAPKPHQPVIQITQATLTQLPAPTPPPPPKVVPPPKPLPAVIPKPPPVQSKIVVATKPPPPVHHVEKPIPHPVINHQPPRPVPQKQVLAPAAAAPVAAKPAAPAAPAPPTNGVPIYGSHMHAVLQANQDVPPALAQLGISGTAYVAITVGPDGHVIAAKIIHSSGNPLIDQTALDHALHASFGAFNAEMPQTAETFVVPVNIQPTDGGDSDSDSDQ